MTVHTCAPPSQVVSAVVDHDERPLWPPGSSTPLVMLAEECWQVGGVETASGSGLHGA